MNKQIILAALEKERKAAEHQLRSAISNAGSHLTMKTGYASAGHDLTRDRPLHEAAAIAIKSIAAAADYLRSVEDQVKALVEPVKAHINVHCWP